MTVTEATRLELEEGARQNRIRRNHAQLLRWVHAKKVSYGVGRVYVAGVELNATFDENGNPDEETLARIILAMAVNGIEVEDGETEADRIRRTGNSSVNDLSMWKQGLV